MDSEQRARRGDRRCREQHENQEALAHLAEVDQKQKSGQRDHHQLDDHQEQSEAQGFAREMALRATGAAKSPSNAPSSRSRCQLRPRASTEQNATLSQITPAATTAWVEGPV